MREERLLDRGRSFICLFLGESKYSTEIDWWLEHGGVSVVTHR